MIMPWLKLRDFHEVSRAGGPKGQRRNYSQNTTRHYIRTVEEFAQRFHCSPDRLGPQHIREYQAELFQERKLSAGSVARHLAALRFFYVKTLHKAWSIAETRYPKKTRHLPAILSPVAQWGITHGMYAMGVPTPRAYLAAALAYNLGDGVAERISCPTLVCKAEGDLFFKGQPEELFAHLTCPKTLLRFSASEGAGDHCQVGAHRLSLGCIYDWLDQTFGVRSASTT
jgi:Phage integrase, N-terminal SAM-like domain